MSDDPIIGAQDKIKSHTIVVTDSYTLDADDTLKLKGNIGFKLLANRDGPVDLTINGAVTMNSDGHQKMVGVLSTVAPNGVAHVTLGDDASLTLTNSAPSSLGATGVALQAAVSSIDNGGDIHVTAASGTAMGVGATGSDLSLDNSGDIRATALSLQAVGALLTGDNVTLVNSGSIGVEAEAGFGLGIAASASVSGTLLNDGELTVSGSAAYGIEAVGQFTSVINNGDITVTCTAPVGSGFGAVAAGLAVSGGILGDSVVSYAAVENNGDIQVTGGAGAAAGVVIYGATGFHNTGHIVATSSSVEATPFHSAGLLVVLETGFVTTNDGVISGEYSLVTGDATFAGSEGFVSDDTVVNSATGQLIGDVDVGKGDDSLTNAGSIEGDVALGDGDDIFDNHAGTMVGAVTGGLGADTLICGAGADHFTYTAVADSDAVHSDLITDLGAGDLIDLAMIDADAVTSGDQAFHLVGAFTGAAGELTVSYDVGADLTTIAGDADGDGVADLVITASGDHHDFTGFVL